PWMSMIIAEPCRLPLRRLGTLRLAAHRIAVDAPDVLRVADSEADLLALHAGVADRGLVQGAGKHLEVLLEAQRALPQAPAAADPGRRVIEVRRAPVAAVAARLLGGVGRPLRDRKAVHHQARAGLVLALELRREAAQVVRQEEEGEHRSLRDVGLEHVA